MIKAALFDIDGVIIRHCVFFARTLSPKRFHEPAAVMDSFYHSDINKECDRGTLDPLDAVRPFLDKLGWKGSVESYFLRQYRHESKYIDHVLLGNIGALRSSGVHCSIASNQNPLRREYLRKKLKAERYFDRAFFSSELGAIKPERLFWEKAYSVLGEDLPGVKPEEVVFLDDMKQNVESAEAYGFQGFVISDENDINAAFENICTDMRNAAIFG